MPEDNTYVYDPHHYLITSVYLPTVVQIIEASPENPYLGLSLMLDRRKISQLMVDSNLPPLRDTTKGGKTAAFCIHSQLFITSRKPSP